MQQKKNLEVENIQLFKKKIFQKCKGMQGVS
jgi:hypothetical protein